MQAWRIMPARDGPETRYMRIAARVNSLQRSDVYRINARVRTVKVWQTAAVLKYWSSSHEGKPGRGLEAGKMR